MHEHGVDAGAGPLAASQDDDEDGAVAHRGQRHHHAVRRDGHHVAGVELHVLRQDAVVALVPRVLRLHGRHLGHLPGRSRAVRVLALDRTADR